METKKFETEYGGTPLIAEFSDIADQSDGSVIVRYGDTVVFASAVMGSERDGIDYFPLTVNYEEKFYAVGKILGSRFLRREGKPSEEAVLTSRLIDRTIRPLFNNNIRREVQVIVYVLSMDGENDPDVPSVIAASLALGVSNIPWDGPVGAVRIGHDGSKYIVNPTYSEKKKALELDSLICGRDKTINMIEVGANQAGEDIIGGAFDMAVQEISKIEKFQDECIKETGKEKTTLEDVEQPQNVIDLFRKDFKHGLEEALYSPEDSEKGERIGNVQRAWRKEAENEFGESGLRWADPVFEDEGDDIVHSAILDAKKGEERRIDGRAIDEIRPIRASVDLFPNNHGVGLFYRGGTHVMSFVTLGGPRDTLLIEGMEIDESKRFMHHYNFPPFSTGEAGRIGSPGRREIGHGALVEKALLAVMPKEDEFPYTVRVVSECMASNGSTSQGSICASTLALMDAGVPIKAPVAGVAMGVVYDSKSGNYTILTDIQGREDHFTDMDFKVAGTESGITAVQMDIKIAGIPAGILKEALIKARDGRIAILKEMKKAISEPRASVKEYAPLITTFFIDPDDIGDVIGKGGKTIKSIVEDTGAEVDIEEDGRVFIMGKNKKSSEKAKNIILSIVRKYKVGEVVEGKVSKILDFGAVVDVSPTQDGLVHISELAPGRVEKVEDVVKVGDTVKVQVIEVGERGKISLSLKRLDPRYDVSKDSRPVHNGRRNHSSNKRKGGR